MSNTLEPVRRATKRIVLALAATTIVLSGLFHFSADLAWLWRDAATPDTTPDAGAPLPGNSEPLSLGAPDGDEAWLPPLWSVPSRSALPVCWILVPTDRSLPPLPLFHPPAFPSTPFFAHL